MNINRTRNLHCYLATVEKKLQELGLEITIETDFFAYRDYRNLQTDRHQLSALFDVSRTYMPPHSAFWIKCNDKYGNVIHSQAFRVFDFKDHSLDDHIQAARLIHVPPEMQGLEGFKIQIPESTQRLSGSFCYQGEGWIHKGLRLNEASLYFGRYGLAVASLFWNADYYFAFMTSSNVLRGLHARVGYTNSDPAIWMRKDEVVSRSWLVWMSEQSMADMIEVPPAELKTRERKSVAA